MATTKRFDSEAVCELIESGKRVETKPWRHGHIDVVVFHHEGALWRVEVPVHSDEGWQVHGGLNATKVEERQKTITVYEAV
jgi:hypothetical protein